MTAVSTTDARTPDRKARRSVSRVGLYLAVTALAALIIGPLFWVLLTSFKTDIDATRIPPTLLPRPFTLEGYRTLLGNDSAPVLRWLVNSLLAAAGQAALIVATASCAAYALARLRFRGKRVLLSLIVATLFVPPVIFLIPNYLIVDRLGWLNTLTALIVPGAASAFGVFFLRQFFLSIPPEIEEAARIDGASRWRIFRSVILPLSRPALATLTVLSLLSNWNDFLWPVYVLLTPDRFTLPPGLSTLQGAYTTHFGVIMAGAVVTSVPVLALFALVQRQLVEGVAHTAVKG